MPVLYDHLPILSWAKSVIGARATHSHVCTYQKGIHLTKEKPYAKGEIA